MVSPDQTASIRLVTTAAPAASLVYHHASQSAFWAELDKLVKTGDVFLQKLAGLPSDAEKLSNPHDWLILQLVEGLPQLRFADFWKWPSGRLWCGMECSRPG
jgi:hypothetical protein